MGVNAQTSVPAFQTGQVLTAQQQTEINTGVPVFATTTTRDAAFGGTGEKVLAEGQLAYIEASDVVQYYNGSAWATLAPATPGALTLISSTTIGSAVSSVTVSSAFSSTYDNYLINVSGGTASSTSDYALTLGNTSTNYYYGSTGMTYNTVSNSNSSGGSGSNWRVIGHGSTTNACQIQIFGPNLAGRTTFFSWGNRPTASTAGFMQISGGFLDDATQYTAFTLAAGAGTLTGGTINVYGYANS